MPEPSSGILGRISGKLLSSNLERDGVDLTFRNQPLDPDLLYLDVNNNRVGINLTPSFDLQFIDGRSNDGIVNSQLIIGNNDLIFDNSQISSLTGAITISPLQIDNPIITMDLNRTAQLELNNNYIKNYTFNGSINLDTSGSGSIILDNNTIVDGNLYVTGNINITGDLSKQGNLILGDDVIDGEGNLPENDTVDFNVPFSQHLLPGVNNGYDIGGSRGDSTFGCWSRLYTDSNLDSTNVIPLSVIISDQIKLDGLNGEILALQSNDDVIISPNTGVTRIENIILEQNFIVNVYSNSTPIILASTGTGYYNFSGTNGIVIPSGVTSERADYEVGATRWNTDLSQVECFDGSVWIIATGPGAFTPEEMESLSLTYTIIFG